MVFDYVKVFHCYKRAVGVIVSTSKIEVNTTIKQEGKVLSQTKKIDAEGVKFKSGQAPIHRP